MEAFWKLCGYGVLWLAAIMLFKTGARNLPWMTVAYIALASTFASLLIVLPLYEFFSQKRLRRELRRARSLHYRETDGAAALDHLLNRSVWAWRQYARLKTWDAVRERHFEEFRRGALLGDLRVSGHKCETREEVIIPRRYWEQAKVDAKSLGTPLGVSSEVVDTGQNGLNAMALHRLAVSTRDMQEIWPSASLARRMATTLFVWLGSKARFQPAAKSPRAQPEKANVDRHAGKRSTSEARGASKVHPSARELRKRKSGQWSGGRHSA